MFDVTVVSASRLSQERARIWTELQGDNPALANPYFSPEFTRAVGSVVEGVEVGVVEEGSRPVAFFPFQRKRKTLGVPVAEILSDFQGLICRPQFQCGARQLLKGCGLKAWDFDHLVASQGAFTKFHRFSEVSPQMDLSQGFEAYAKARREAGSEQIKKCANLMRRIEREIGPLRFVANETSDGPLKSVLDWKSQQYAATGKSDIFGLEWPCAVVRKIHATQTEDFSGMLSLLYAGDQLLAGHFGMRSRTVWHHWFPSYDPNAAKYSPGLILLLKMAEHAPSIGIKIIDLGKGMALYKERLMTGGVRVASGSVELPSLRWARRTLARTAAQTARRCLRFSGLTGIARTARDWLKGGPSRRQELKLAAEAGGDGAN